MAGCDLSFLNVSRSFKPAFLLSSFTFNKRLFSLSLLTAIRMVSSTYMRLLMWETWVQSLGWEDPLEEGKATHSSILAWRIPMDRGAWRATVHGVPKNQI